MYYFAGLTLEQLSNCPDAQAYGDLVMSMLWGHFSPVMLSISAVRIIFKILHNIFQDV